MSSLEELINAIGRRHKKQQSDVARRIVVTPPSPSLGTHPQLHHVLIKVCNDFYDSLECSLANFCPNGVSFMFPFVPSVISCMYGVTEKKS